MKKFVFSQIILCLFLSSCIKLGTDVSNKVSEVKNLPAGLKTTQEVIMAPMDYLRNLPPPPEVEKGSSCKTGNNYRYCYPQNAVGIQIRECKNGLWMAWGKCIHGCKEGFHKINDQCVPHRCTGESFQQCEVENGMGISYRNCRNNGWTSYSICEKHCKPGYEMKNGKCEKKVIPCEGPSEDTLGCVIGNGIGKKTRTCVDGKWGEWGNCTYQCKDEYVLKNNTCVYTPCEGPSVLICDGIKNGYGLKRRTCKAGIWSEFGSCQLTCNEGSEPKDGNCVEKACEGPATKVCPIVNGKGVAIRLCRWGNWNPWAPCVYTCNDGYYYKDGACYKSSCVGSNQMNCPIANGTGFKQKQCVNGSWTSFSNCNYSCNPGYVFRNGKCVSTSCSGSSTQNCSVENGTGIQKRSCVDGVWQSWGSCEINCNSGYLLINGKCQPQLCNGPSSLSCEIENGTGVKDGLCVNGSWSYGPCRYSCNEGHELKLDKCEVKNCIGESNISCGTIANGIKTMNRTCSKGSWVNGTCNITCNPGYKLSGESCIPQCEGSPTESCGIIHNGTSIRTRTCTSGTWSSYGECKTTCNPGYTMLGNRCVTLNSIYPEDPYIELAWYLGNVGWTPKSTPSYPIHDSKIFSLWGSGYSGRGIKISLGTPGINTSHEDLSSNFDSINSRNFSSSSYPSYQGVPPTKDNGTALVGIAVAKENNNQGIRGVSYNSSFSAHNWSYIGNISQVSSLLHTPNYDIMSFPKGQDKYALKVNSGSNPEWLAWVNYAPPLKRKISDKTYGANLIRAIGDQGQGFGVGCADPEIKSPQFIMVGSYDYRGIASPLSNKGSCLWVLGPGGGQLNENDALISTNDTGYGFIQGSGAAANFTSAAIALLLEAKPNLHWRDIKFLLAYTASKPENMNLSPPPPLSIKNKNNGSITTLNLVRQVSSRPGWIDKVVRFGVGFLGRDFKFHFHEDYGFGRINIKKAIELAKNLKSENLMSTDEDLVPPLSEIFSNLEDFKQSPQTFNQDFGTGIGEVEINIEASADGKDRYIDSTEFILSMSAPSLANIGIEVTSPKGTKATILHAPNAFIFNSQARNLSISSSAFYGEPIKGVWKLKFVNVLSVPFYRTEYFKTYIENFKQDPIYKESFNNAMGFETTENWISAHDNLKGSTPYKIESVGINFKFSKLDIGI